MVLPPDACARATFLCRFVGGVVSSPVVSAFVIPGAVDLQEDKEFLINKQSGSERIRCQNKILI